MIEADRLAVIYLRPLDLSVDEVLAEIFAAVRRIRATRVVIDSLSGSRSPSHRRFAWTSANRCTAWSVRSPQRE